MLLELLCIHRKLQKASEMRSDIRFQNSGHPGEPHDGCISLPEHVRLLKVFPQPSFTSADSFWGYTLQQGKMLLDPDPPRILKDTSKAFCELATTNQNIKKMI